MLVILRIMKFTFYVVTIIALGTQLLFASSSVGQTLDQTKISIQADNKSLKEILTIIEQNSNVRFTYNEDLVNPYTAIVINKKNTTVGAVLKAVLANTNLDYVEKDDKVVIIQKETDPLANDNSHASIVIKGNVSDDTGKPLSGVTVKLKGSSLGVATNPSGDYSITIPDETGTLVFSFISYQTQEIKVHGSSTVNVTLKPSDNNLKEVVVVGYGTQNKSTVSGAITTVKAKDVALSPDADLSAGLAGRIPGVIINDRGGELGGYNQPSGKSVSIFIRGISTTGDASPLIVIDGIVRDYDQLQLVSPNDVASISVLKDGSAAIYGSRAANGVILVTTKRGTEGKPTITATVNQSLVQQERVPESADAYTFATMSNLEQQLKGLPLPYTAAAIQAFKDGSDPLNYPNTNWQDLIFKKWFDQTRGDVSVSGGTPASKYFISAGYLGDNSPFIDGFTYSNQYHFRSNIDAQINKDLKVSLDVGGIKQGSEISQINWAHIFLGLPTAVGIYPNGDYGSGRTGFSALSMARDPNYGYINQDKGNFTSKVSAEYTVPGVEGLSLLGNFAYDFGNDYTKNWMGVTYYDLYDPTTQVYTKVQDANTATPTLAVANDESNIVTSNIRVQYNRTFSQKHTIDAFVGFEQSTESTTDLYASRTNYASQSLVELFAGDANKLNQANTGSATATGRENLFGRALYTYDDKYNLQFQFRYDGSDIFPPGKQWGFFPGVSGNWNINKENFMQDVKWVDNLKLRASYAELGNDQVAPYQYLTSYTYGNNYAFNGQTNQGLAQENAPNPNITWEVAKTTDIGLEGDILNGILNFELDVFLTKRSNVLEPPQASVPAYTGLTVPDENIGRIKNEGYEINLTHASHIGDFKYSINGNFTYAKNTVLFIDETPGIPSYQRQTGMSLGTVSLFETAGIYKTQAQIDASPHQAGTVPGDLIYVDVNHDGVINSLDEVRQPYSPTPRIVYGANFRFDYKRVELILGFQGQAEAYGEKYSVLPFDPVGWGDFPSAMANNVWSPTNPNGTNPAPGQNFTNGTTNTTWRYASMAFLKLKTTELSYNFSSELLTKAGFKSARVFVSGSNLFFIHDDFRDINLSPEQTGWGWGLDQLRTLNLGLSVTL